MSGGVWHFLFCCQDRKKKDAQDEITEKTRQSAERKPRCGDTSLVDDGCIRTPNDNAGNATECNALDLQREERYEQQIRELQEKLEFAEVKNKELSMHLDELRDLLSSPGMETDNSSITVGSAERWDSWTFRQQLETMEKEKRELEAKAQLANESVKNLKHEIAVLQKRLQLAENPPPLSSPPRPPTPPLPPPPPPPTSLNPLRSLFSIIHKKKETSNPPGEHSEQGSIPVASGESSSSSSPPPLPVMNEMLQLIRHGVSLKPVVPLQKDSLTEDTLSIGKSVDMSVDTIEPELDGILKRRKQCADHYISDGSLESLEVDLITASEKNTTGGFTLQGNASKGDPSFPCQPADATEDNTVKTPSKNEEDDCSGSSGDDGSTASTLPLSASLDNQEDVDEMLSKDEMPCKDLSSVGGNLMGNINIDLQTNDHDVLGAILTDLMTTLKNQDSLELQEEGDTIVPEASIPETPSGADTLYAKQEFLTKEKLNEFKNNTEFEVNHENLNDQLSKPLEHDEVLCRLIQENTHPVSADVTLPLHLDSSSPLVITLPASTSVHKGSLPFSGNIVGASTGTLEQSSLQGINEQEMSVETQPSEGYSIHLHQGDGNVSLLEYSKNHTVDEIPLVIEGDGVHGASSILKSDQFVSDIGPDQHQEMVCEENSSLLVDSEQNSSYGNLKDNSDNLETFF
ncbi:uncharacterized protein LOC114655113 isoform X2 [Erpetoichthys calabaricus]|uniref:uncharacterized protein LOC114655113 isoform X2 n=1 Tax=Erpetoichthys calabaricus TaxID=27687 RepID=UPI0010A0015D|nr:uncharacterized protein LOC114655113 isoform X2 [Erpetoichthys calabaricus]